MHGRRRHAEKLLKVSFGRRSPVKLRVHGNVRQVLTLELGKRILFAVVRFHVQALLSRLTRAEPRRRASWAPSAPARVSRPLSLRDPRERFHARLGKITQRRRRSSYS